VLKLLKKESYQNMPWKNGQGETAQIAIYPDGSSFANNDFQWRLSSASVKTSTPFSLFNGYDRWLTILNGEGLELNGNKLGPLTPLHFSGEIPIRCELLGSEVIDLGLIYRRDKFSAQMSHETLSSAKTVFYDRGTHLFFCVSGELKVNDTLALPGDTITLEGPFEATLSPAQRAQYFYIRLST
jgi:environmental stress-induced protein Ves